MSINLLVSDKKHPLNSSSSIPRQRRVIIIGDKEKIKILTKSKIYMIDGTIASVPKDMSLARRYKYLFHLDMFFSGLDAILSVK